MAEMKDRIKQKRKKKGFSQTEIGLLLGVNRQAVCKWENGNVKNMKRSTIEKMAHIFNVSPSWLMGYDSEPVFIKYENGNDPIIIEHNQPNSLNDTLERAEKYAHVLLEATQSIASNSIHIGNKKIDKNMQKAVEKLVNKIVTNNLDTDDIDHLAQTAEYIGKSKNKRNK